MSGRYRAGRITEAMDWCAERKKTAIHKHTNGGWLKVYDVAHKNVLQKDS